MIAKIALAAIAIAAVSCSSVEMPKGSSKGYSSARLVTTNKKPYHTESKIIKRLNNSLMPII